VSPIVETSDGRLRGREQRGIRSFLGIPYARPPVGLYRFRAPERAERWSGVRDALRFGPAALQPSLPLLRSVALAGGGRQAEDCLYLNVWTPGLDGARRPVLVWIHGGGFLIGSGGLRLYDGAGLARRGDLVVVTLNYRLGALGFLHLHGRGGELVGASNAGLRDQIAALAWVRENIARFGGDPEQVTICGQSAGAMSVAALLGAPTARPLFARAILQSGAADHVLSPELAERVSQAFLEELGGPAPTRDALARLGAERVLGAQARVNRRMSDLAQLMVFLPTVDGDVLPEPPLQAIARGAARQIPLLIGTTLDEWKLFTLVESGLAGMREVELRSRLAGMLPRVTARAPEVLQAIAAYRDALRARGGRTTPFEVWCAFQSARVFHYPASKLAEAHAAAAGSTYGYLFTWRTPLLRRALGAFHALDVPFVFGLGRSPLFRSLGSLAGSAARLAAAMQDAWAGFARSGDPGHRELPTWPRYDASQRATMLLGRRCALAHTPLEAERRLWQHWSQAGSVAS